jgi:hypothetical protein
MSPGRFTPGESGRDSERPDDAAADGVGERLSRERPAVAASFRTALGVHLSRLSGAAPGPQPRRLGRLVGAYAGCGLFLLALAAILSAT